MQQVHGKAILQSARLVVVRRWLDCMGKRRFTRGRERSVMDASAEGEPISAWRFRIIISRIKEHPTGVVQYHTGRQAVATVV